MFLQTSKIYMNRTINCSICYFKSYHLKYFFYKSGSHLLSHTVSSIVPSAAYVLTIVFGMGTGVSHKRIATRKFALSSQSAYKEEIWCGKPAFLRQIYFLYGAACRGRENLFSRCRLTTYIFHNDLFYKSFLITQQ